MMKLKKIAAIVLAIMMMAMVGLAYGADNPLVNGKDGEPYSSENEGQAVENNITIKKQIVVYNTNGEEIYLPNVVYTYTASVPADLVADGTTVTDGDGDTGVVYAGVIDAITNTDKQATATYATTDEKVAAGTTGTVVTRPFDFNFDPSKFTHAGIYRYLITETNDGLPAAGIYRDATNYTGTEKYLDVYVRNVITNGAITGKAIYGYVLSDTKKAVISEDQTTNPASAVGLADKTEGWMATVSTESGHEGKCNDADIYNTYNLKVTKNITGSLAETSHKFPMSVALTLPTGVTKTVRVYTEGTSGAVTADDESFKTNHTFGDLTANSHIKLANEEYVLVIGIPAETTAVVTEINDTYDIYKAEQLSIANGTSTAPDPVNLAAGSVAASQYAITAIDNAVSGDGGFDNNDDTNVIHAGDVQIVIKNNMEIVSPTGYVARFAPYALILIGGIALLIIAKKHKKHTEEE